MTYTNLACAGFVVLWTIYGLTSIFGLADKRGVPGGCFNEARIVEVRNQKGVFAGGEQSQSAQQRHRKLYTHGG